MERGTGSRFDPLGASAVTLDETGKPLRCGGAAVLQRKVSRGAPRAANLPPEPDRAVSARRRPTVPPGLAQ